jgi:mannose-6-phosphate isomerase-like protein (cupin superfamily)
MKRVIIGAVVTTMLLLSPVTFTQGPKPPDVAIDIYAPEIKAVLDAPSNIADRLIHAVDMGKYIVGVGVLRRGPTKAGAPVGAINHDDITEVYYIIAGTGTLVTGGTVTNARRVAADNEIVKVVVGPSSQGTFDKPAQRRKVGPGDVVIIPPGVYHGFDEVPAGGIDYLAVRPDPKKVLPAGYWHPAIQALKGAK